MISSERISADPAMLTIGADLRVTSAGEGWSGLGLGSVGRLKGKRIDELFQSGDLRASVLDVLASGQAVQGVLIPLADGEKTRYLCANLSPLPTGAKKPNKVLLHANELNGWLLADAETGEIVGANEGGATAFGSNMETILGKSLWGSEALTNPQERESIFTALNRRGSMYLGRFRQRTQGGEAVELEGTLVLAPE